MRNLMLCGLFSLVIASSYAQNRLPDVTITRIYNSNGDSTNSIIYGELFGVELKRVDSLPALNEMLMLMGISSAGYAGIKVMTEK